MPVDQNSNLILTKYESTQFDFSILEHTPLRTLSVNQSSSMIVQLTAGFDIPYAASVITPIGAPVPELKTLWQAGLRITFNWRHYL